MKSTAMRGTGLLLSLFAFAAADNLGAATLKGTVKDGRQGHQPIEAVDVTAVDQEGSVVATDLTAKDGSYTLEVRERGTVTLKFERPGYVAKPTLREVAVGESDATVSDVYMAKKGASNSYYEALARGIAETSEVRGLLEHLNPSERRIVEMALERIRPEHN